MAIDKTSIVLTVTVTITGELQLEINWMQPLDTGNGAAPAVVRPFLHYIVHIISNDASAGSLDHTVSSSTLTYTAIAPTMVQVRIALEPQDAVHPLTYTHLHGNSNTKVYHKGEKCECFRKEDHVFCSKYAAGSKNVLQNTPAMSLERRSDRSMEFSWH